MHLLTICLSSSVEYLFKSFTHFKNELFIFLSLTEISSLYIPNTLNIYSDPSSDSYITHIFSLSLCGLPFYFLQWSFKVLKFSILMTSNLLIISPLSSSPFFCFI